ncbi:MAG: hypothetical protein JWR66_1578, partial [Modestobacter sp.]|nr:hypothetical protein [Modestobacter sp.]
MTHTKRSVPEDDPALRATLTQVVLADLRAGRSPLGAPAVAALRILASGPATTLPDERPDTRPRPPLRRAG